MSWNPETHPYRVRWIRQSSNRATFGWRDDTKTFRTKDDALAAINEKFSAGTVRADLEIVVMKNGKPSGWRELGRRKMREPFKSR